jgi:hypothetical protein
MRCASLVVAALALAACARAASDVHGWPDAAGTTAPAGVRLVLNNHHWLDLVVKIESDGETYRVGQVSAASSAEFAVPGWMLGASRYVRLIADPVGTSDIALSDWLDLRSGGTVEWTVEGATSRTSLLRY